jgi:hypothetical protein
MQTHTDRHIAPMLLRWHIKLLRLGARTNIAGRFTIVSIGCNTQNTATHMAYTMMRKSANNKHVQLDYALNIKQTNKQTTKKISQIFAMRIALPSRSTPLKAAIAELVQTNKHTSSESFTS